MNGLKNNIVIIYTDQSGNTNYYVNGDDVSLVMVDDNVPDDRIYEWLSRDDIAIIQELIPEGSVIGSSEDDRHAAVVARLLGQPFGVINGGKADSE